MGVAVLGHRDYVGGLWDEVGKLQFEFLVQRGLRPEHVFLDIACGSLRGGIRFIPYLDPGNYLGIEKEQQLIDIGLKEELASEIREDKQPEFVISDSFEFTRFSTRPDFSLAQSLFTHLNESDIQICLGNLRDAVDIGHLCFVTFFNGNDENPNQSHAHKGFWYTPEELSELAGPAWESTYIGEWGRSA